MPNDPPVFRLRYPTSEVSKKVDKYQTSFALESYLKLPEAELGTEDELIQ